MNLLELKKWINELPEEELGQYNIVYRKAEELYDNYWYAMDIPIAASGVDVGDKEVYFCDEESYQIIKKNEDER